MKAFRYNKIALALSVALGAFPYGCATIPQDRVDVGGSAASTQSIAAQRIAAEAYSNTIREAGAEGGLSAGAGAKPGAPSNGSAAHGLVLSRPPIDTSLAEHGGEAVTQADRLATDAVKLMMDGDLKQASKKINAALSLRIDRSYYHLINALIYHLEARTGQNPAYDLAEQGYQQAINFDPSNWQAYYFAGLLGIDMSKFDVASKDLAQALYLHPNDASLLNAFAYAAYRSGNPDQAAGAINAMEAMGGAKTAAELRNAAVIMAAVGEQQKAFAYLDRLKAQSNERVLQHVQRRVSEWNEVYRQPGLLRTQFGGAPDPNAGGGFGGAPAAGFGGAPAAGFGGAPGGGFGAAPGVPGAAPGTQNKMIVVDVVLISTEENFSTARGLNLLRGLQIQFGNAATNFAFQRAVSNKSTSPDGSSTTTITRYITIPSINYNLNIFNANNSRDEILARPTLVATSGRASTFFSGEELNAVVVNSSNNSSASPVSIQKEIGTSLALTPTFLPDGQIMMKVTAQRTFIKNPSPLVGFDAHVETAKAAVDATVVMRPGETLILGGLSEKEAQTARDGVPLLQDVPLLQYMFSNATTVDYQKSTLILITPRPAQYVYQPEKAREAYEKSLSEDERPFASLRARYSDWFRPYPNWASVFHHLQENSLFREFRTGDVTLENWSDMRTLKDRLKGVLEFLYY